MGARARAPDAAGVLSSCSAGARGAHARRGHPPPAFPPSHPCCVPRTQRPGASGRPGAAGRRRRRPRPRGVAAGRRRGPAGVATGVCGEQRRASPPSFFLRGSSEEMRHCAGGGGGENSPSLPLRASGETPQQQGRI